jgi:enoyl-CoA hydratase
MIGAAEAHRVGVINRLFEPEELEAGTLKLAETILSRGPVAVRLGMEAINRGLNMTQQEGEIIESDMFGLASTTADMREGMTAFLEKRAPNFTGK